MQLVRSLRFKTAIWALFPIVLVLTLAAGVVPVIVEEITRRVVRQRDAELARLSAARFSDLLRQHARGLYRVAVTDDVKSMDPGRIAAALQKSRRSLLLFNVGTYVHDAQGRLVQSVPADAGRRYAVLPETLRRGVEDSERPVVSNVFRDNSDGSAVVSIVLPLPGEAAELVGTIVGIASLRDSSLAKQAAELLEAKAGRSSSACLVDENGIVIYHQQPDKIGKQLDDALPFREAIDGGIGAVLNKNESGETAIIGFAPVPGTRWALLTREAWDIVVTPARHYRLLLIGILLGGIILSILLIFIAISKALRPIHDLTEGAQRIAEGDFDYTISASSGDEIQTLSEQFNQMARTLKLSYADLEGRVKERTADLAIAKQEAEEADRLKSVFLATISHELRTPLHSILGFAVTLQREMGGPLNPEQKKQLGVIHDCATHLLALITDILDLSKIEAGRMELHSDDFDVSDLINQAVLTVGPLARKKNLQLASNVPTNLGCMRGDKQRIRQVLLNLLDNALKFTDSGSVTVSASRTDGHLTVTIEDTGIGIDPKTGDRLFESFHQLDSDTTRRHEGTGLGLAICKKLVTMMNGSIDIKCREGGGTVAGFSIPEA